jgi:hypothetical protein
VALTLLPSIAVLAIAYGGGNEDISQAAFWEPFRAGGGLEAEGYATLSDMAESADLVARGRFVAFEDSREVTGDVRQDVVTYGATTFVLDEVIRGRAGGDRLVVEFIINERPDRVAEFIATQAANLPEGEIIVFLRAKRGRGESGLYRLVNSVGLWTTVNDRVQAPLAEILSDGILPYADELASIQQLDELAAHVSGG